MRSLRIQDQGFVFFHFRGDVAFSIDQRLFANVIRRGLVGVAVGDFDVITENLVVTNFEGLDAGSFAFEAFQVGDPFAGMPAGFDD